MIQLNKFLFSRKAERRVQACFQRWSPTRGPDADELAKGVNNPETFAVEDARSQVYGLRGAGAAALAETFRARVTGKVYNHSKRMKEKRAVWTLWQPSCAGSSASPQRPNYVWLHDD